MNQGLFAIFDSAAGAFSRVFQAATPELAIRAFRGEVENPQSPFHQFPEDYTLFQVGGFDQATGALEPMDTPHSLGLALQFMPQDRLYENLRTAEPIQEVEIA